MTNQDRDSSISTSIRIGNRIDYGFEAIEALGNEKGGSIAVRYWMPNLDQAISECTKDFFKNL
ncbi:hypothetical protein K2X30_00110 [bacterium]|nr:hypothetical protein [bacterium]